MTARVQPDVKWDVSTPELLRELVEAPLPLRLKPGPTELSLHRDLYFDTSDASLSRLGLWCRLRFGANDRRILTVTVPSAETPGGQRGMQRFDAPVSEVEAAAALSGGSEPARRLSGLVNPAELQVLVELETERRQRTGTPAWPWRGRFRFVYDLVTVRHGGLVRGFQELKLRRLGRGTPRLEAVSAALGADPRLRAILEKKLARAQRLRSALEGEALVRSVGAGRAVTVIALEEGRVALRLDGEALRLPSSEGSGEAACRHLLRETFGSGVGDLALLGTAAGQGSLRLQEVWLVRRLRRDGDRVSDDLVWLPVEQVAARAGGPGLQDPETLAALAVATRSDLLTEREASRGSQEARPLLPLPPEPVNPAVLLDADLSLVEFNLRVLALAEDGRTPLLERLGYLAIVSANLDEFFMVNVAGLKRNLGDEQAGRLEAISLRIRPLLVRQQRCLSDCLAQLAAQGIRVRAWDELDPADRTLLAERFRREIFPLLAPRAITMSPGFPVPVIPHLALCVAVMLLDARTGPVHFAYLKVPDRIPRFLPVGSATELVPVEEVIRANLHLLYPDREIDGAYLFRLTRAGDIELADEDAGDLLQAIEEAVRQRPFNAVVRVEVERQMPQPVRERLMWELWFERGAEPKALGDLDVYEVDGMLDLRALGELATAPVAGGRFPLFEGRDPLPPGRGLWELLRERDRLVHHPYDSFAATVVRFFSEAASDPDVVAIRLTLYRAGERSPIVDALVRAAAAGKEVSIFVELKARFDEARNIGWVRRLEEAGANVVYGVVGLKNHAKVGLVLRREGDGLRHYAHIGTGNYNAATARMYTDLGLFSADPELAADLNGLFNELTGSSHAPGGLYRKIAVAPKSLLPWLLGAIEREIAHAQAGRPARIRAKLNGLGDGEVVNALYQASQAGVEIDLIIRGLCTLRPGVPGLSDRIRVVSLLGRFLEHARIYHFSDGGEDRYYIGSADWRQRNLRRRIEVVAPVTDAAARARLGSLLDLELGDPDAWELRTDGSYQRRTAAPASGRRTSQEQLVARTNGEEH